MFDLACHIEHLLMSHDCVVAPGLGAFLIHETPARYDEASRRFMPPTRATGFNEAVTINDGLLAESVARREHISLQSATTRIEAEINSFRHQLAQGQPLAIGQLGEMRMEDDGRLIFNPSEHSAATLRYNGLMPLNILTLQDMEQVKTDHSDDGETSAPTILPIILKIAASLIFLMVAGGIFLTTNRLVGERTPDMAFMDSGIMSRISVMAPQKTEDSLPLSREIRLNIAVPRGDSDMSVAVENMDGSDAAATGLVNGGITASDRYILVIGSFPKLESAQKYIVGKPALRIHEMDGRYRIYAASAVTNAQAHVKANALRGEYPNVWICQL
ncbi:MAG: hypothetical protein K2K92_10210 [Duncaniella sp.]|nr:hypothetical protein [Duncaniella sp.]